MNNNYIAQYNKDNYKQYIFRVRKDDMKTINKLDKIDNKNSYFYSLINSDRNISDTLSIKQIKQTIKPILNKYGIKETYLFGSYARGEATKDSDVDIYCEKGKVKDLIDYAEVVDKLEVALNKKVDLIFTTAVMQESFKKSMQEDLIKLC